jgi:hypothetical protein
MIALSREDQMFDFEEPFKLKHKLLPEFTRKCLTGVLERVDRPRKSKPLGRKQSLECHIVPRVMKMKSGGIRNGYKKFKEQKGIDTHRKSSRNQRRTHARYGISVPREEKEERVAERVSDSSRLSQSLPADTRPQGDCLFSWSEWRGGNCGVVGKSCQKRSGSMFPNSSGQSRLYGTGSIYGGGVNAGDYRRCFYRKSQVDIEELQLEQREEFHLATRNSEGIKVSIGLIWIRRGRCLSRITQ